MTNSLANPPPLSRRQLTVHTVLVTLIVIGTLWRLYYPFACNPFDSLFWDCSRHLNNAFDVRGEELESLLNCPGFEIYLSTLVRILGTNRDLHALAMALLSGVTPWLWYRWLRELLRDKTLSLFGYVIFTYLPSWFQVFGYFMDSVILLPLTGAGLWLTWRAARKASWKACLLASVVSGAACATKAFAVPMTVLPWLLVGYKLSLKRSRPAALAMTIASVAVIMCGYGLGPLKVWTHMNAFVPLPDGMMNQRYFESGAIGFQVENRYRRIGEGDYVQAFVCESGSPYYPPFHPFNDWKSSRRGRYYMTIDYMHGRDDCQPIKVALKDRLRYTLENIIFFFFQYQWPEEKDTWSAPFPGNLPPMVRFIWFPLTIFLMAVILKQHKREFMGWYFVALTLAFTLQQSGVMEGRYKKQWEGVAIATLLTIVSGASRYQSWKQAQATAAALEQRETG